MSARRVEGRRGAGECQQDEPGEKSHLDKAPFDEVVPHPGPDQLPLGDQFSGMAGFEPRQGGHYVVSAEEEDVGGEVERGVEEGVESDETTEADEEA